jgi:CheY-like chemotaxis protein
VKGGSETILLAEDEPQVRLPTVRSLTGLGYEVLVATNGAEALSLASAHHGKIDLLVTDVVMPGMRGNELAAELRRLRPDLRVLYISGYAEDSASIERALAEGDSFLPKPFTVPDLARRVRALLDHLS